MARILLFRNFETIRLPLLEIFSSVQSVNHNNSNH